MVTQVLESLHLFLDHGFLYPRITDDCFLCDSVTAEPSIAITIQMLSSILERINFDKTIQPQIYRIRPNRISRDIQYDIFGLAKQRSPKNSI